MLCQCIMAARYQHLRPSRRMLGWAPTTVDARRLTQSRVALQYCSIQRKMCRMTKPKRQRNEPIEQWEQLELRFTSPEQRIYEQIRPVVLFGVPPPVRAREIGAAERTLYRQVQRFAAHGMRSLFAA